MKPFISELEQANIGELLFNEPMANHTTWKIGGPADLLLIPKGKDELVSAIRILHKHSISWTSLGRGSNMLVRDKGIRGVVIKPRDGLDYVRFEDNLVHAGAGYSFIKLAVMTGKNGLSGLEFAGGIPGAVGGAVYMNAGAHGSDVSRIFRSADIVLETGEVVRFEREDMQFSYRHSILHEKKGLVLEATFELTEGDRKEITTAMNAHKERRLRTQPLQLASCGSVFRNPTGDHAARLIEEAGLKGARFGGAEVSELHSNFIINTGQATAEDVLTLISHIQATIQDRYGIALVPEVLVVGER
ncbi:UDP-N-acetylmuramate dehydrogenase [Paenibacillus sp. NEAU-GSW1]|uniref:UDP-N-acetylmuramate dehydrogenase n=1 Tax=Paenibacillus sp. NEAU-GSW1 TaxID=2682486 RepID=UPI0012E1AE7C|nr:UDP-N-acetylmuramate dehydrogenase [Paenibacillus sp. NEAU-GSW1]MUT66190.1 UDP-N-acetylmuramate dehydrogenase [Paenibacillus sp. NEAU-GSW1]